MTIEKTNKKQERQAAIDIIERALQEFRTHGKVLDTRCDRCGNLIEMKTQSDTSVKVGCQCGKFNDTLRGI